MSDDNIEKSFNDLMNEYKEKTDAFHKSIGESFNRIKALHQTIELLNKVRNDPEKVLIILEVLQEQDAALTKEQIEKVYKNENKK